MLVRLAWTGPPAPACKLAMARTPAQPCFAPLQVILESGLIVRSYSGGQPLCGLTLPLKMDGAPLHINNYIFLPFLEMTTKSFTLI